jgi:VWFA-related protein
MFFSRISKISVPILFTFLLFGPLFAQEPQPRNKKEAQPKVRTVTIPISIFTKEERRQNQQDEFIEAGDLSVREDGDEQTILSIRSVTNTPLHLAVLIQDDLTSNVNLQLEEIKKFIRRLPPDSRVMVTYLRAGTNQIRQKFTTDLERAAESIRIVTGSSAVAPRSPYDGVEQALERFDALPTGRRAILLVSDGLDVSSGLESSTPGQSLDLDQAILKAQRRGVAVYSFYSAASLTQGGNSSLILNAQGSLNRLSEETGGRAYFQGSLSPISFETFFRDLNMALTRQFALTYLSTHMKKGYHKVQVTSTNAEVKIEHPKGYYYRGN